MRTIIVSKKWKQMVQKITGRSDTFCNDSREPNKMCRSCLLQYILEHHDFHISLISESSSYGIDIVVAVMSIKIHRHVAAVVSLL